MASANPPPVCDTVDRCDHGLLELAYIEPDDLIVSDALSASLMAQLTDRPWLTSALSDLFDFHGSALFARHPARWNVPTGRPITFGELIAAAAQHDRGPVRADSAERTGPPASW